MEVRCFDLFSHRYYEMPLPESFTSMGSLKLTVLKGNLCIVKNPIDICILKEYGNNNSWIQLFHASQEVTIKKMIWDQLLDLVCFKVGRNHIFLAARIENNHDHTFVIIKCNLESKKAEILFLKLPEHIRMTAALHWMESLVPLSADL